MSTRLAVVERGGELAVYTRTAGPRWARTPIRTQGRWPAWHPHRDLIASSAVDADSRDVRSSIEISPVGDGVTRLAYVTPPGSPPAIALRVPHYVLWSPEGDVLSMVVPGEDGLRLVLADADGAFSGVEAGTGAPMFEAWSPDGQWLAWHGGDDLKLHRVSTGESRFVAPEAIGFRAPAFSSDGRWLVAARPWPPGVMLVAHDVESGRSENLAPLAGGVALSTIPGTSEIAVALTVEADAGVFQELLAVDTAIPGAVRRILRGPFVSAIWSPNGERVALVVPLQTGDGRYALRVHGRDGAFLAATEAFVPSQDLRVMLGFFDQYAHSHRLWSADGGALLITGRLLGDGRAASFSDEPTDYVYFWRAERGQALELVGPGEIAFFAAH